MYNHQGLAFSWSQTSRFFFFYVCVCVCLVEPSGASGGHLTDSRPRSLTGKFWRPGWRGGVSFWHFSVKFRRWATGRRDTGRCCSWCRPSPRLLVPLSWSGRSGPVSVLSVRVSAGLLRRRPRSAAGVPGWTAPPGRAAGAARWAGWAPGCLKLRTCPLGAFCRPAARCPHWPSCSALTSAPTRSHRCENNGHKMPETRAESPQPRLLWDRSKELNPVKAASVVVY